MSFTLHKIDARTLLCPMPLIKLQQAIQSLNADDQIEIMCGDPGVEQDIPLWCKIHGHQVLSITKTEREINVIVQVGK